MSEQQQQQQQQQLVQAAAKTNVPSEVNRIDGEIVIDLLSEAGQIDITQPDLVFDFKRYTNYKLNKKGRIIYLKLGYGPYTTLTPDGQLAWIIDPPQDHSQIICWVLPNLISELPLLEELHLFKCQSLPIKLNLQYLHNLVLVDCDENIMKNINEASEFQLPAVQILDLISFSLTPNSTSIVIAFMKQLPSLDTLCFAEEQFNNENRRNRSCVPLFDFLKNDDCAFLKNKLKQLYIEGFSMTKSDVVSFFNDVLPEFPDVYFTSLWNNQIETLQGVGPNLIMNPNSNTRHNLTTILIDGNPVTDKLVNNDENERNALLKILLKFPRVSCLGIDLIDGTYRYENLDKYGPDIEYVLRINYAGRILVERSPPPAVADDDTTISAASRDIAVTSAAPPTSQFSWNLPTIIVWNNDMVSLEHQPYDGSIIPLSVWPIVFERAAAVLPQPSFYHGRGLNQYTGLFYLLQKNQPYIEYMANLNSKKLTGKEEDAGTTTTTTTISREDLEILFFQYVCIVLFLDALVHGALFLMQE